MSKRTAKPSHKAALTVAQKPEHQADGGGRTHYLRPPHSHVSIRTKRGAGTRGTVADAPSKTGQQPPGGYGLLGFQAGFPSSWLVTEAHTVASPNLRRPVLQCPPTGWAAAAAPNTPPRPSLPVLAVRTPCAPVPGPARRSQSLELDRPQISRNHLLQNPPSSNSTSKHTVASATVPGFTSGD